MSFSHSSQSIFSPRFILCQLCEKLLLAAIMYFQVFFAKPSISGHPHLVSFGCEAPPALMVVLVRLCFCLEQERVLLVHLMQCRLPSRSISQRRSGVLLQSAISTPPGHDGGVFAFGKSFFFLNLSTGVSNISANPVDYDQLMLDQVWWSTLARGDGPLMITSLFCIGF